MAVDEGYLATYEATDDLVRQALDAGACIKVGAAAWRPGSGRKKMCVVEAVLTRPDGRTITLEGMAEHGDAQAEGADPDEPGFKVLARAQVRARRAVARVYLDKAPEPGEGQLDWQKRLQILMREVGNVTGHGRDAVAREVRAMFGVESTSELLQSQAAQAIRGLEERLAAARGAGL